MQSSDFKLVLVKWDLVTKLNETGFSESSIITALAQMINQFIQPCSQLLTIGIIISVFHVI